MLGEVLLQARGLTRTYRMGEVDVHALCGVDLELYRGELLVLLGPSGSGKSTLLNLFGGLDVPSAGTLRFGDLDLVGAEDKALTLYRRHHVGFVFQFYNLIPSLTALENVQLVTEIARQPLPAGEALALVGLTEVQHNFPSQMSGGQQQRVAIARAIAKRPTLLFCDEPTGALDAATGRAVLAALARINQELGTTMVIITHNAAIGNMADRVVTLADGGIASVRSQPQRAKLETVDW